MRIPCLMLAAACFALASPAGAQVARVSTSNGTVLPDASTVFIESASLPGEGLVVVRAYLGSKLQPGLLATAPVKAGESANLRVKLGRPVRAGEMLVLFLHADRGRLGVYDGDPLVLSVDIPEAVVRTALAKP